MVYSFKMHFETKFLRSCSIVMQHIVHWKDKSEKPYFKTLSLSATKICILLSGSLSQARVPIDQPDLRDGIEHEDINQGGPTVDGADDNWNCHNVFIQKILLLLQCLKCPFLMLWNAEVAITCCKAVENERVIYSLLTYLTF